MRRLLILALMLPVVLACGDADQPTDQLRQVQGSFAAGDGTYHFVGTYRDTMLQTVEVEHRHGDLGRGRTRYDVVGGHLVYVRTEEQRRAVGRDADGRFETVVLELEFDPSGRLIRQKKTVDGQPVEPQGYEAPGARRHFQELRERVDQAQQAAVGGMQ
jgi:hypothetical protein